MSKFTRLFNSAYHNIDSVANSMRKQGFSDADIAFVQLAHHGFPNQGTLNLTEGLAEAGRETATNFLGKAARADEIATQHVQAARVRGVGLGAVAATFIGTEFLYSTNATQENYQSWEDSAINNGIRIAAVTAGTVGVVKGVKAGGASGRAAALLSGIVAVGFWGAGSSLVSHQHLKSSVLLELGQAEEELAGYQAAIENMDDGNARNREAYNDITGTIRELQSRITEVRQGSGPSQVLLDRREELEADLAQLETQFQAWNTPIGEHRDATDFTEAQAQAYRDQGFTNVGIEADKILTNDTTYDNVLKPAYETNKSEVTAELAQIKAQINQAIERSGQEDALNGSAIEEIAFLEQEIDRLRDERSKLLAEDPATDKDQMLADIAEAQDKIRELNDALEASDDNMWLELYENLDESKGFAAVTGGLAFGAVAIAGGTALEFSAAEFRNNGKVPKRQPGSVVLNDIPVEKLSDDSVVARYANELNLQAKAISDGPAANKLILRAAHAHSARMSSALSYAYNKGILTDEKFNAANRELARETSQLSEYLESNSRIASKLGSAVKNRSAELDNAAPQKRGLFSSIFQGSGRAMRFLPLVGLGFSIEIIRATTAEAADIEAEILSNGDISLELREDLLSYANRAKIEMNGTEGVSILDPTIIASIGAYNDAMSNVADLYEAVWDKHRVELAELGVPFGSWSFRHADGIQSIDQELLSVIGIDIIPETKEGLPSAFHTLVDLRNEIKDLESQKTPYNIDEWDERLPAAQEEFSQAFAALLDDESNHETVFGLIPLDHKISVMNRLAVASSGDTEALQTKHPVIAQYLEQSSKALSGTFNQREFFTENLDALNSYLMERLGINSEVDPTAGREMAMAQTLNTAIPAINQ